MYHAVCARILKMEAEPETEFTYEIAEDVGDGQAGESGASWTQTSQRRLTG